jgi:hypothetical protein
MIGIVALTLASDYVQLIGGQVSLRSHSLISWDEARYLPARR